MCRMPVDLFHLVSVEFSLKKMVIETFLLKREMKSTRMEEIQRDIVFLEENFERKRGLKCEEIE